MRCVLDTNVFVAALLSRSGAPAEVVRLWLEGAFEVVVSPLLFAELRRVLAYPKIRSRVSEAEAEAEAFLALVTEGATIVDDPVHPPSLRTADPKDEFVVAIAEEARAVIVSGDQHLLEMAGRLPVLSPEGFRRFLARREAE